ncbi:DUF7666 domain-containing protein [Castellaniella ginsengisoli]
MAKKTKAAAAPVETITAYKGFTDALTCTGGDTPFQYEVGKTYKHKGDVRACNGGFHACEYPLDVFGYYPPAGSRFALVEQSGDLSRHDSDTKVASRKISIKAEIGIAGLVKAAIEYTTSRCLPVDPESPAQASGDRGAAQASGDRGAAQASGDRGAAQASGYQGAAQASGYQGAAQASGYQGAAQALGKFSTATAAGIECRARGVEGSALFLVYRDTSGNWDDQTYGRIAHARAVIVGQDGVKPDTWYMLNADGDLVEASE